MSDAVLSRIEEAGERWGVEFDREALEGAVTARPAVQKWLAEADATRAVRIGQLLALGPPASPAHRQLLDQLRIGDAALPLGDKAERTPRLRVLVADNLDEIDDDGARLVLLASSAGELVHGNREDAWDLVLAELQPRFALRSELEIPVLPQLSPRPEGPAPTRLDPAAPELANWKAHWNNAGHVGNGIQKVASQFENHREILESLRHDMSSLVQDMNGALPQLWEPLGEAVAGTVSTMIDLQQLSWWGTAKYSLSLRRPYRRLESLTLRMIVAAREAAKLATRLPVEPSASFLVEMLRALDVDPNERRQLHQWIAETQEALREPLLERHRALSLPLQQIVDGAAAGLAAAWCFRNVERKVKRRAIADELGLDISVKLDRGQWISWLFRECLLDEHLKDA